MNLIWSEMGLNLQDILSMSNKKRDTCLNSIYLQTLYNRLLNRSFIYKSKSACLFSALVKWTFLLRKIIKGDHTEAPFHRAVDSVQQSADWEFRVGHTKQPSASGNLISNSKNS